MKTKVAARYKDGVLVGYVIWCQGCKHAHVFPTDKKYYEGSSIYGPDHKKPIWSFSGTLDKPTFTPSLRCYYTHPETKQEITTCHSIVTDGRIQFCADCQHELKGQILPLEDFPANYEV
jgi:hypothetical protein